MISTLVLVAAMGAPVEAPVQLVNKPFSKGAFRAFKRSNKSYRGRKPRWQSAPVIEAIEPWQEARRKRKCRALTVNLRCAG